MFKLRLFLLRDCARILRLAWRDEMPRHLLVLRPGQDFPARELRAVVAKEPRTNKRFGLRFAGAVDSGSALMCLRFADDRRV